MVSGRNFSSLKTKGNSPCLVLFSKMFLCIAAFSQVSGTISKSANPPGSPLSITDPAPTCFDGQITGPNAKRIAHATVGLLSIDKHGKPIEFGSGTIIADSAPVGGSNLITSAAHLLGQSPHDPDIRVKVFSSSSGKLLGIAKPVYVPADYPRRAVSDKMVLEISPIGVSYDRIQGVPIRNLRSDSGFLSGMIVGGGTDHGSSGGSPFDSEGYAIGIVTNIIYTKTQSTVHLERPLFYKEEQGVLNNNQKIGVQFPYKVRVFGVSYDNEFLQHLGNAGKNLPVTTIKFTTAQLTGFPQGICSTSAGDVKALDLANASDFDFQSDVGTISNPPLFADWSDPEKATSYIKDLMARSTAALPDDLSLGEINKTLQEISSLADLDLISQAGINYGSIGEPTIDGLVRLFADAAAETNDIRLRNELTNAAAYLPRAFVLQRWNITLPYSAPSRIAQVGIP